MEFATAEGLLSTQMSIIREEVDSLIRAIDLLLKGNEERADLIKNAIDARVWGVTRENGDPRRVPDARMVDSAGKLHDWVRNLYDFGCSFIHLTGLHDYQERDPFRLLSSEERESVSRFVNHYYGTSITADSSFAEIREFVPRIFKKVAENLERYLHSLEENEQLN
jgi:hypothetical protein